MIRRTFDAGPVNRICNHPEVRPWLGGSGEIDVAPVLANEKNYALFGPEGGFILHAGPGASFEVHSQFTPEGRHSSIRAMLAGMDYMFTRTECLQITTFLPDANPRAKAFGKIAGFRDWFRRDTHICGPGMQGRIDIDDWISRTADLEKDGERFHQALEASGGETNHAHDGVHERYVGAALRLFERGQSRKAEALYNRWAVNAGYVPIRMLSDNPPVVDVGTAVVTLGESRELEVLECR